MRYRYTVSLYSDTPSEAEIADYLSAMPRSRRQEAIRMLIKMGFSQISSNQKAEKRELPLPTASESEPKEEPRTDKEEKQSVKKSPPKPIKIPQKTESEEKRSGTSHINDSGKNSHHKRDEMKREKDQQKGSAESLDDPLSKISELFDGISSE